MVFHFLWLLALLQNSFNAETENQSDTHENSPFLSCMELRCSSAEYKKYCISDDRYADVEYPELELSVPLFEKCRQRTFHLRTILGELFHCQHVIACFFEIRQPILHQLAGG